MVAICSRCEVNPKRVTRGGRVQAYCRECTLEVNRIYKRRVRLGVGAESALEKARALIIKAWTAGKLGDGPLRWSLGMTAVQFDLWGGEREQ